MEWWRKRQKTGQPKVTLNIVEDCLPVLLFVMCPRYVTYRQWPFQWL